MAIALYFDKDKDDGSMFAGVPKRDLTQEEFDALPKWQQKSVEASPLYRKTNPNPTPRKTDGDKET
jgi:hypothetical protein